MRASLIQCSRVTISLTDRSSSPCRSSLRSGNVSGSIVSILVPLRDRGDSGDVFPHSEPRGGQRQEGNAGGQVNRAATGRVLQATVRSVGPWQHSPPGSYYDFIRSGSWDGTRLTSQACSTCSVQRPLWPLSVMRETPLLLWLQTPPRPWTECLEP